MRVPNAGLEKKIRKVCLDLLMEKEPEEIGMRDIALACGVSATTIYYYYRDKQRLFDVVKLDCLESMDAFIGRRVASASSLADKIRAAIVAFRDWAFENPRISLLVMGRLQPTLDVPPDELARYYGSTGTAKALLDEAVAAGLSRVADTQLAIDLAIAAVWGATETVLLKRTHPDFWDRGTYFTDRMIDACCSVILTGGEK